MMTATAIESIESTQNSFQLRNMFIELTEIGNLGQDRPIYVNITKIQSFFGDPVGNTLITLRRETMKVTEDYETVKSLIALNEHRTKTKTKS